MNKLRNILFCFSSLALLTTADVGYAINNQGMCELASGQWKGYYKTFANQKGPVKATIRVDKSGHLVGKYHADEDPAKPLSGVCSGGRLVIHGGLDGTYNQNKNTIVLHNSLVNVVLSKL